MQRIGTSAYSTGIVMSEMKTPERWTSAASAVLVLVLAGGALGQAAGGDLEPRPTDKPWGPPQIGLQTRLELKGTAKIGQPIVLTCELRNASTEPMQLRPKAMFAWLFVVQDVGGIKAAIFTEKIFLAGEIEPWLKGTTTHAFRPMDVTQAKVYGFRKGIKVRGGYPAAPSGAEPLRALGTLGKKLLVGPAKVRMMLYVALEEDRPRLLVSNTVDMLVQPPKLSDLDPAARKAFVDNLIAKYKSSAWGGMKAHSEAVQLGRPIVPDLIRAVNEPGLAYYAAAWMCASLCHIRDEQAVAALLDILQKGRGDLHAIVAYHGPGQRDKKLDEAIIQRVASGKGTGITALAALGFMVSRGRVPEKVLEAGLESDDPKVRGKVADVMKARASDTNINRAIALLKDKDQKVRAVAARVLGYMVTGADPRSTRVCRALIGALDEPGESPRQRICEALSSIAAREMFYDPQAPAAERKKVLADWKAWWADVRKARHEKR